MLRRALPMLAALILVAGIALAATDPGRRTPDLATVASVNDVAISDGGTRISAATNDAGSTQLGQNPDQDVWYLWDEDGAVLQHGAADRASCAQTAGDQCQSPALHIATNDDGSRLAVVSRITRPAAASSDEALVVFATSNAGEIARFTLEGQPRGVAMSASGALIAVLTENKPSTLSMDTEAKLFVYNWGAGNAVSQGYEATMADPGLELAVSRDGQRILVATNPGSGAGKVNWFTGSSSSVTEGTITGARPAALAVAGSSPHRALAGYQTGDLALFSDNSKTTPLHKLQYGGGSTPVTDVAIARSGLQAVAGYSDGTVRLFSIEPSLERLTRLGTDPKPTSSPITQVAYSGDGKYVVVASGTVVVMYDASSAGLAKLWETTLNAAATSIAVDFTGDHVAVASGSAVAVFEAKRTVVGSFVGPIPIQATPGARVTGQVRFDNTGNRADNVALDVAFPSGWFVEAAPSSFVLSPGQSKTIDLTIVVPSGAEPRLHAIYLNQSRGSTRIDVNVPVVHDLVLDLPEGPGTDIATGGSVARALVVANRGNVHELVRPVVQASDGWSASLAPSELSIPAGDEGEFQLTLRAPVGAAPGSSGTATVTLPGVAGQQVRLTATVGATFGVDVGGPAGLEVPSGQNRTLEYTVRNTGNTPDSYDLVLTGDVPSGWSVRLAEGGRAGEALDVSAGETRTVPVLVAADRDADAGATFNLELTATSQSDQDESDRRETLVSLATTGSSSTTTPAKGKNGIPAVEPALLVTALALLVVARRRKD